MKMLFVYSYQLLPCKNYIQFLPFLASSGIAASAVQVFGQEALTLPAADLRFSQ